jgi:hypothetical protein
MSDKKASEADAFVDTVTTVTPGEMLLRATRANLVAQREDALATLAIYFNQSVGIGDHSNHTEEILKHLRRLAEADECLETINRYFQ